MQPVTDQDGIILNAMVLTTDQITHKHVRCPVCAMKDFAMWPEGWDAHAAHKCAGLDAGPADQRKLQFRAVTRHLFQ